MTLFCFPDFQEPRRTPTAKKSHEQHQIIVWTIRGDYRPVPSKTRVLRANRTKMFTRTFGQNLCHTVSLWYLFCPEWMTVIFQQSELSHVRESQCYRRVNARAICGAGGSRNSIAVTLCFGWGFSKRHASGQGRVQTTPPPLNDCRQSRQHTGEDPPPSPRSGGYHTQVEKHTDMKHASNHFQHKTSKGLETPALGAPDFLRVVEVLCRTLSCPRLLLLSIPLTQKWKRS